MEPIKVGLVGYGKGGEYFHAPVINAIPELKLVEVVERHKHKSQEKYPWVKVVKSYEEMLKNPQIRLVVITTPNWFHFEMAYKALQAGKHVVVDKPFSITSKEADTLIELAQQKQLILSVYHNRRWDGGFLTVKRIVENNWLGDIKSFECRFDRYRPDVVQENWRENGRAGSGLLYDLGPHLIDHALELFGLPLCVKAEIKTERARSKTDDFFDIELTYKNNVKAYLKASMLQKTQTPHFVLKGTEGTYTKYGLDPQEAALKKGMDLNARDWGYESADYWGFSDSKAHGLKYFGKIETIPGRYQSYYENIYKAIKGEEPLAVTPEDGRDVVRIIELCIKSSRERKQVDFIR